MPDVLIIEVDLDSRLTLEQYLARVGLTVSVADNGEQAIALLQERSFDFVIAPLCLHGVGGRGVSRWVKAHRAGTTRVYITTSWKGELELDLLRFDGIAGVLKKPYSFGDIRNALVGDRSVDG